jgi:hypothetical protein
MSNSVQPAPANQAVDPTAAVEANLALLLKLSARIHSQAQSAHDAVRLDRNALRAIGSLSGIDSVLTLAQQSEAGGRVI